MNEEQYAKIVADLARNDKEHESYNRRLKEHDDELKELSKTQLILERLTNSVSNLATTVSKMDTTIQRVDTRVEKLEQEPADKWKKITWEVVKTIVLAVAAYALGFFTKG